MQYPAIAAPLISWYALHHRVLPWRETSDPYAIWLSEIILQQTRVEQGRSYYERFLTYYPTVQDLAAAPLEQVLLLWQGLGYYSRARNLHAAAQQIVEQYGGVFPREYAAIRSLKGVGDYTAAAIASFAYDLPYAVLDGNVFRVLSRLFNDPTPIDTGAGKKLFQSLADALLTEDEPHLFNQAIMELGALVCTPKSPKCDACPLVNVCIAHYEHTQESLPLKKGKTKVRDRFFHYFIIEAEGEIYLQQRTGKDIWSHLFEFYLVETEAEASFDQVVQDELLQRLLDGQNEPVWKVYPMSKKHILSHQHLYATFYHVRLSGKLPDVTGFIRVAKSALDQYALPQLIVKWLAVHGSILNS